MTRRANLVEAGLAIGFVVLAIIAAVSLPFVLNWAITCFARLWT